MSGTSQRGGLASLYALFCLVIVELGLYQVAVPATKPTDPEAVPPVWHQVLEYVGLFFFYFASVLAFALLASKLSRLWTRREYPALLRTPLVLFGGGFAALSLIAIFTQTDADTQFLFESAFSATLLCLVLAQANRAGSFAAKLGLALLATPFWVYFYGPLWARWTEQLVADSDLPEKLGRMGQWTLAVAALAMPFCFGPRPLSLAVRRPGPVAAAVVACFVSTLIVTGSYEVSAELAYKGLGIDIGPGAPRGVIALYVLALGAGTWTLIACLGSANLWRQQVGVGVGLVGTAGYGFQWPVQYLCAAVGLVAIGEAASRLGTGDDELSEPPFRSPPVPDDVWDAYLAQLGQRLEAEWGQAVVVEREGQVDVLRVDGARAPLVLRLFREDGVLVSLAVHAGTAASGDGEPDCTLEARPQERTLGSHPSAPICTGKLSKTGDDIFDRRFWVRDAAGLSPRVLGDDSRTRAAALLDGWVAMWSDGAVVHTVYPGRGAPVDSPVPITELAFRGEVAEDAAARLVRLSCLLADWSERIPAS